MTQEQIIEAVEKMTVLELNTLVKAIEEKWGVSAAAVAVAGQDDVPAVHVGVPAAASGGSGKSGPTTIVIANYTDPNEFIRALSMSSGQDAVINVISSKKATIKRILG